MSQITDTTTKYAIDALSISTIAGTLAGLLPHLAALLSVVWGAIRIYETRTVQGWLGRRECPTCAAARKQDDE